MPFTFSHPAAVLPFYYLPKKYISMTGLVIGSMAPDFEYFIRMKDSSKYSHSWTGLFYFDLPLTFLLAFVFHLLVKNKMIDNLPVFLRNRLVDFKSFNWTKHLKENFGIVLISIIVGVASHIVWDGFTHAHGQFVDMFYILRKHVSLRGHRIPLYALMQHLGSIVGLLVVIYALMQLPAKKTYPVFYSAVLYWMIVMAVTVLLVSARIYSGLNPHNFDDMIVVVISGGLAGLIVASFVSLPESSVATNLPSEVN